MLATQPIDGLVLGVGGLILAVWRLRSVLVPGRMEAIAAVDLALSGVILLPLIGVVVRRALHPHLHRREPAPRRRWVEVRLLPWQRTGWLPRPTHPPSGR